MTEIDGLIAAVALLAVSTCAALRLALSAQRQARRLERRLEEAGRTFRDFEDWVWREVKGCPAPPPDWGSWGEEWSAPIRRRLRRAGCVDL